MPARHSQQNKQCFAATGGEPRREKKNTDTAPGGRRDFVLNGSSALVLGSLFDGLVDSNTRPAGLASETAFQSSPLLNLNNL